jgi:hypothetical protein
MAVSLPAGFPKTPSAVRVATSDNYVSTLDIHKPDIDKQLIQRYGIQSITPLVSAMGRMIPVAQTEYSHYEETFIHQNFQFSAGTAPASGYAELTVTIAPTFMDGNYTYAREKDVLQSADGRQFLVTETSDSVGSSLAANEVKIKPSAEWDSTAVINIDFIVIGRMNLEGGRTPDQTLTPRVNKYTNNVMIIDDAYFYTGTEGTNQTWVEVEGVDGKSGYLWYLKGENDTRKRFENYAEMEMLLGKTLSNAAGSLGADGYRSTRGMIPDIQANGQTQALGGSPITMADITAMIKSLDKYRGAKNNKWMVGFDLRTDLDALLASQNGHYSGGFNYGLFEDNESVKGLKLEFDRFRKNGYNFDIVTYDLFNDPKLLGADGFPYSGSGIVMPMDVGRDPKTNKAIPSVAIRYKEVGGNSRLMEHWLTGGTNGVYTNDVDGVKCNYRTERGFEIFAPNRFFWVSK